MKTSLQSLCIIAITLMCSTACKKQENMQGDRSITLENNVDFKNYVATDLLSRVRYSVSVVGKINKAEYFDFKNKLSTLQESALPFFFSEHHLEYATFQKLITSRVIRRAKIIQMLPEMNIYPDTAIDRMMNEAYDKVANEILEKASKQLAELHGGAGLHQQVNNALGSQTQSSSHTVNMLNETEIDDSFLEDYDLFLSSEVATEQIVVGLDKVSAKGISVPVVLECFKSAIGLGGLTMAGIASWARLSAGMIIQETIAFATKWALKHIGWIGAAVAVYDFTTCLYNSF